MLRTVTIENGIVEGLPAADPRVTSFKGIPFAAPPVGKNRWRAPQPAPSFSGVMPCHAFAPIPLQAKPGADHDNIYAREWNPDENIPQSENCLHLNIWTNAKEAGEKKPVYVWFYGGALQVGNTAEMEFDGERLARRGIVVVTAAYRLNVFGFFAHPALTKEAQESGDPTANFGLLDQRFAVQWVKRNIAAFGGDPDNITIGGQSAGGASVAAQLVSPLNAGLFQKAIIQSGFFASPYQDGDLLSAIPLAKAEAEGEKFFAHLGVSSLDEARALPGEAVRDKMLSYRGFWSIVADGTFCLGDPFGLLLKGEGLDVPVLAGHTSSEFMAEPPVASVAEFAPLVKQRFGDRAEEILNLCPLQFDSLDELKHVARVSAIGYSIRRFAEERKERGGAPVYYYNFDASVPGWDNPGTFHSVDLWFFFETLAKCWRPFTGKHYDLARLMCNYWAEFIKKGDPNGRDADGSKMPLWQPYAENSDPLTFCDDAISHAETENAPLMRLFSVSK